MQQVDVASFLGAREQGVEDRSAGGIGRMDDAAMAVPAFAGEVIFEAAAFAIGLFTGEGDALLDQPLDGFATMFDRETHRFFIAKPAAGDQSIGDMGLDRVGIIEHSGHSALGPVRRAVGKIALAEHSDAKAFW